MLDFSEMNRKSTSPWYVRQRQLARHYHWASRNAARRSRTPLRCPHGQPCEIILRCSHLRPLQSRYVGAKLASAVVRPALWKCQPVLNPQGRLKKPPRSATKLWWLLRNVLPFAGKKRPARNPSRCSKKRSADANQNSLNALGSPSEAPGSRPATDWQWLLHKERIDTARHTALSSDIAPSQRGWTAEHLRHKLNEQCNHDHFAPSRADTAPARAGALNGLYVMRTPG